MTCSIAAVCLVLIASCSLATNVMAIITLRKMKFFLEGDFLNRAEIMSELYGMRAEAAKTNIRLNEMTKGR